MEFHFHNVLTDVSSDITSTYLGIFYGFCTIVPRNHLNLNRMSVNYFDTIIRSLESNRAYS